MLKNGVATEIFSLINNEEIRPSTNIVVSKCSAYDYINNSIPSLEKMTIKYYETFAITSRFTGYISNITIGQFYDFLSTNGANPTAILGGLNSTSREELSEDESSNTSPNTIINPENLTAGSSSVSGNRGAENIGIAVFKNDTFCGELTAIETICHLLLVDDIDSFIISINSPISKDNTMELQLVRSKNPKINISMDNNIPHIDINLNLEADILTLENNINYQSKETLEKISNAATEYMKTQIANYLNKVCIDYGTDIDDFYTKALSHFKTISEWENFNWSEKIKEAKFDINVDVNVTSSLLITQT